MMNLVLSVLLAAMSLECRAQRDNVLQPEAEKTAAEGEAVTLGCHYNTTSSNHYLFWYKQHGDNSPTFILSRFKIGTGKTEDEDRFSSTLDSSLRSVPLKIQKLQLSDSAVYYCALQPGSGYKMIFGGGSRVTVETKELYKPSYYKLQDETTSLCLATGFSRIRGADEDKKHIFNNRTGAVRIEGDSLFNQVGYLLSDGSDVQTCGTEGGPVDCDESLQPDPQVNLVSLTVLGLRLLFMKTVVFNVLLTLRLWITS